MNKPRASLCEFVLFPKETMYNKQPMFACLAIFTTSLCSGPSFCCVDQVGRQQAERHFAPRPSKVFISNRTNSHCALFLLDSIPRKGMLNKHTHTHTHTYTYMVSVYIEALLFEVPLLSIPEWGWTSSSTGFQKSEVEIPRFIVLDGSMPHLVAPSHPVPELLSLLVFSGWMFI